MTEAVELPGIVEAAAAAEAAAEAAAAGAADGLVAGESAVDHRQRTGSLFSMPPPRPVPPVPTLLEPPRATLPMSVLSMTVSVEPAAFAMPPPRPPPVTGKRRRGVPSAPPTAWFPAERAVEDGQRRAEDVDDAAADALAARLTLGRPSAPAPPTAWLPVSVESLMVMVAVWFSMPPPFCVDPGPGGHVVADRAVEDGERAPGVVHEPAADAEAPPRRRRTGCRRRWSC